jgi:uncharacterized protein YyaL (SSP411 family)
LFSAYYAVAPEGNWEHGNNILTRHQKDEAFLERFDLKRNEWETILKECKRILLLERSKRIKPGLDDKIITGWNAMMISGLVDAYKAFSDESFLALARQNMLFLEKELMRGPKVYRSYRGRASETEGFLDDYAFVIQAYMKVYQVTFEEHYLDRASLLLDYTLANFFDTKEEFFFYSSSQAQKLITRKKELFDNVIPSSNAVMAQNLYWAGTLLYKEEWIGKALKMTDFMGDLLRQEPNYMSYWGMVSLEIKKGLSEVVLLGRDFRDIGKKIQQHYSPFVLFMGAAKQSNLPLARDKQTTGDQTTVYVCFNRTCASPVTSVESALEIIRGNDKF